MTIEERVNQSLQKSLMLSGDQIRPGASFVDDLAVSSLDRFELVMGIEDEFGIELTDEEQASIITVNDLIECVKSRHSSLTTS